MKKIKLTTTAFLLLGFALLMPGAAFAVQDVVLDADLNVDLTSPAAITLVIASGATMDNLVVNSGNIVITMSAGNFPVTITSADRYRFSVTGIAAPGTTCGVNESTITLPAQFSAAVAVTLTPSTICAAGSGGGEGTSTLAPEPEEEVLAEEPAAEEPVAEEPAQEAPTLEITELVAIPSLPLNPTVSDIQVVIDAILTNISVLQAQLVELVVQEGEIPAACVGITFTRALTTGSEGNDVKCLQTLLNQSPSTQVASLGVGSAGSETSYFGSLTTSAVGKFQLKYGVVADSFDLGYGLVGPKTRAKLNQTFGL